jgi:hypothetical protein
MGTVAGARTLDRRRDAKNVAGLDKSGCIVSPRSLVEIDRKKPTGLVLQQGIYTHYMTPKKVVEDYLIGNGQKILMWALATLDLRLVAYPTDPFIVAGGCVANRVFSCILPSFGEDVDSTAK